MDDRLARADDIETLERRVWDALVTGDTAADEELLAADFLGVYPTGYADRADHVAQLAHGPTVAAYELSEQRTIPVTADAVLFCYRADYRRLIDGAAAPSTEAMWVSSLWCRRGGRWVNIFSQDTPPGEAVV